MRNKKLFLILSILIIFLSCDYGINPDDWLANEDTTPGFGGSILFKGKWPPVDSLYDLRLVVYKDYPPANFFEFVKFSDSTLTYFSDKIDYKMFISSGEYKYVVVAQQFGPNLFLNWRAVGFYSLNSIDPAMVKIYDNKFTKNINIVVDFDHTPKQPF